MRSEKCIALITVFILKDRREYKEITSMAIYVRMNANINWRCVFCSFHYSFLFIIRLFNNSKQLTLSLNEMLQT